MGDDVDMEAEDIIETLRKKFVRVAPVLDERGRRVWAAAEAEALGYGGQGLVAKATGLARTTLYREGVRQAKEHQRSGEPIRRVGGGRKKLTIHQPELQSALEALV
ncbi:MAG: ISAzo13 family transposase, partial [Candidatus Competibacteraceae bacterium]|nr:ISAzo13 family transposase [Candidatus Competibacteraceae bacterium]